MYAVLQTSHPQSRVQPARPLLVWSDLVIVKEEHLVCSDVTVLKESRHSQVLLCGGSFLESDSTDRDKCTFLLGRRQTWSVDSSLRFSSAVGVEGQAQACVHLGCITKAYVISFQSCMPAFVVLRRIPPVFSLVDPIAASFAAPGPVTRAA